MNLEHATPELFAAIASAQAEVENATKSATNPHFKSRYADLAEVLNTVRPVFARHGLAVIQAVSSSGQEVTVTTTIAHKTGGFVTSALTALAPSLKVQDLGSVTTYLRRYSVAAMAGISQEDDDGNAASQVKPSAPAVIIPVAAHEAAAAGTDALKAWFQSLPKAERETISKSKEWTALKAQAQQVVSGAVQS